MLAHGKDHVLSDVHALGRIQRQAAFRAQLSLDALPVLVCVRAVGKHVVVLEDQLQVMRLGVLADGLPDVAVQLRDLLALLVPQGLLLRLCRQVFEAAFRFFQFLLGLFARLRARWLPWTPW